MTEEYDLLIKFILTYHIIYYTNIYATIHANNFFRGYSHLTIGKN